MLLSTLNRKEKLKFLDLALHMVSVDGEPTAFEQRLLNIMVAEVGDGIVKEYHFSLSQSLEETLTFFDVCNKRVKNICYLNLLRLTMFDDFYNTDEHDLLERVREHFSITELKKQQFMRLTYTERDLKERATRLVRH